jgi:hypothetical protein
MKIGPTGRERYISYGMYELYDLTGLLKKIRGPAGMKPSTPKLDATMTRYIGAYEAFAPVANRANDYYDRKGYQTDNAAEGRALHARMVPLANTFLIEREAMLRELRPFAREVEQQEIAAVEAREGRSRAWQAARIMYTASRVVDLFPRTRPMPIDSDTLEEQLKAIGPNTPGEEIDELIAGVTRPTGTVIDMNRFDDAMKEYAEAVDTFDGFAMAKPDGLQDFKDLPRRLLNGLRALQEPLARNQGREFNGAGRLVGQIVQTYFSMLSESSSISDSRLRFLP